MKKDFTAPEIKAAELNLTDAIMASSDMYVLGGKSAKDVISITLDLNEQYKQWQKR